MVGRPLPGRWGRSCAGSLRGAGGGRDGERARRRHRDPEPGRQRGVAVLEQLPIRVDALGTGRQGGRPQVAVVVLADAQDAQARRPSPIASSPRRRRRGPSGRRWRATRLPRREPRRTRPPSRPEWASRRASAADRRGGSTRSGRPRGRPPPRRPGLAHRRGHLRGVRAGRRGEAADPGAAHRTVQVSPPPSSFAMSPAPWRATASRICASISSSCVGRGTFRITPIGTGNSGQ